MSLRPTKDAAEGEAMTGRGKRRRKDDGKEEDEGGKMPEEVIAN